MNKLDRNKIERYELKYIIPSDLVGPISDYSKMYCEQDHFSKAEKGGFYRINSLYFDTKNYHFLENKRSGVHKRFNMRARTYGAGTEPPIFFEVKEKRDRIVNKIRSKVSHLNLKEIFDNPQCFGDEELDQVNLQMFMKIVEELGVEPKILTHYRRLAFFSIVDDYVRITFDKDLKYYKQKKLNLCDNLEKMKNYDFSGVFSRENARNIILEIKTLTRVPQWILDMIQYFDLNLNGFSKFESSINESNTEIDPYWV